MKASLLFVLLLPLPALAQFGRSYTGPTMQQNMQSRQQFNNMTNQRTQDFQQRHLDWQQRRRDNARSGAPETAEARAQAQAKQQKLEQEANEKLALLAQEQQRRRQKHPAKNAQQAAIRQKADDRQLTALAIKNYREIFLPAQVASALDAQALSPRGERSLHTLTENLQSDGWWKAQEGPQLLTGVKACGDTLTALTTALLGFDLTAPPAAPAPLSMSALDSKLAKDAFDQPAATQLIQEAGLAERLAASGPLIRAAKEFAALTVAAASNPEFQGDAKKLRKEVQKSMRAFTKEMGRYNARLVSSENLAAAEQALRKSTAAYLAKNGGGK